MSDPVEVELKLEYDPADRERLLASPLLRPDGGAPKRLVATYFDTPDLQLSKASYALRIRREGNKRIQTVKATDGRAVGLFVRGEWERPVRSDKPILDEKAGPLGQMLDAIAIGRIAPIFVTDVERHAGPIERGTSLIEYAIDGGEVRAGQRSMALSELELELKQGTPQSLFDLARALNEEIALRLGVRSKSARGYALMGSAPAAAFRAEPIELDPAMHPGEAFATIAAGCIRHYRMNEAVLLRQCGAEAIHQARVAIRRLRSAFSLFKPLFAGDDQAALLAAELRWLAGELGDIRDIDVLLPKLDAPTRETLAAVRDVKATHLRGLLESGRVRALPIDLVEWLAIGRWQSEPSNASLQGQDIRSFASGRLDRLRKRIKREGRGLSGLADEPRHEVRKDAKRLRYASEFLVSLYPKRKARRRLDQLLDHIEELQDRLGRLNDFAAAPDLLARLGLAVELPGPSRKQRKHLLADAENCFEALIDTKPFWRV